MNRLQAANSAMNNLQRQVANLKNQTQIIKPQVVHRHYDVFINHRGADTKLNIASLLYNQLLTQNILPFLDKNTLKPGDNLFESIHSAVWNCKLGVALFSPRYCESYFCLHELALMFESKKKVIPIFCDINPSDLKIKNNGTWWASSEMKRFSLALEQAKCIVGLKFDSSIGNWADVVMKATDVVTETVMEIDDMLIEIDMQK